MTIKAAGVIFVDGTKVLLIKRTAEGDYVDFWGIPGGKLEQAETPQMAAMRECQEEIQFTPNISDLRFLAFDGHGGVDYTTFVVRTLMFDPVLNAEHSEAGWFDIDRLPEKIHPRLRKVLQRFSELIAKPGEENELEIARSIVAGRLQTPYHYENVSLVAMRITGTGAAYRKSLKEYVYRRPENYLTDNFLARCNGLPVIWEHPDGPKLTSEEFEKRVVGTMFLPYIKGSEVWGIAKIYDASAAQLIADGQLSTSPAVYFRDMTINETVELEDGTTLFIEGDPPLLDHLAICEVGVWDKGQEPFGVLSEARGDSVSMTEEEMKAAKEREDKARADADAELGTKLDRLLSGIDALCSRADAMDARLDSLEGKGKSDAEKAEEAAKAKEREDKERADAEAKKEREDKARRDEEAEAERKRMDAEIAELKKNMPKQDSDEDAALMADAQGKADSIMTLHGKRAPRPLMGETLLGYRRRVLSDLKQHSEAWKSVDLAALPDAALMIAEGQIFKDSAAAAMNPVGVPEGTLREVVTIDGTGRRITSFVGEPSAWMSQWRSPSRRLARPVFNTNRADARS